MKQIELVIKLPIKTINRIKSTYGHDKCCGMFDDDRVTVVEAIVKGTPLPKGHGVLKDTDKLIKDNGLDKATKYGNKTKKQLQFSYDTMMMYEIFNLIDDAEVVVEADKEGAEE